MKEYDGCGMDREMCSVLVKFVTRQCNTGNRCKSRDEFHEILTTFLYHSFCKQKA